MYWLVVFSCVFLSFGNCANKETPLSNLFMCLISIFTVQVSVYITSMYPTVILIAGTQSLIVIKQCKHYSKRVVTRSQLIGDKITERFA